MKSEDQKKSVLSFGPSISSHRVRIHTSAPIPLSPIVIFFHLWACSSFIIKGIGKRLCEWVKSLCISCPIRSRDNKPNQVLSLVPSLSIYIILQTEVPVYQGLVCKLISWGIPGKVLQDLFFPRTLPYLQLNIIMLSSWGRAEDGNWILSKG